jgi:hypothetical protein
VRTTGRYSDRSFAARVSQILTPSSDRLVANCAVGLLT